MGIAHEINSISKGEKDMSVMEEDRIREAVLKTAVNGRLSCTAARKVAAELQVSPGKIGEACNQLKIKIHSCELGCFK